MLVCATQELRASPLEGVIAVGKEAVVAVTFNSIKEVRAAHQGALYSTHGSVTDGVAGHRVAADINGRLPTYISCMELAHGNNTYSAEWSHRTQSSACTSRRNKASLITSVCVCAPCRRCWSLPCTSTSPMLRGAWPPPTAPRASRSAAEMGWWYQ